jgi:hypothetical protein
VDGAPVAIARVFGTERAITIGAAFLDAERT